jgi:hypothetical protein
MKGKHKLNLRKTFALACPGVFFTLSFWSLGLLFGTAIYYLISGPSAFQSTFVTNLVNRIPFTSVEIVDTPQCPDGSRLLFTFNLPGVSSNSCYRNIPQAPYIEIGSGWWKCNSGLYSGFQYFDQTNSSKIWNLGQKFACVKDIDISVDDFEYESQKSSSDDTITADVIFLDHLGLDGFFIFLFKLFKLSEN